MPWYSGTAVCTDSTTCSCVVYWHIGTSRDLWTDEEVVLLEFFPHYLSVIAIHDIKDAFSVMYILNVILIYFIIFS